MQNDKYIKVLLSLGSNIGNKKQKLLNAAKMLNESGLLNNIYLSSFYETEPVGYTKQDNFLNISITGYTNNSAEEILFFAKSLEYLGGRKKRERWHNRELDVDIIFYGDKILQQSKYVIPHPLFRDRKFVLMPSAEIAGDLLDPVSKKSINELLIECSDTSFVRKIG